MPNFSLGLLKIAWSLSPWFYFDYEILGTPSLALAFIWLISYSVSALMQVYEVLLITKAHSHVALQPDLVWLLQEWPDPCGALGWMYMMYIHDGC